MDRGHKKEYFNVMYTSYKNRHANRDTLMYMFIVYLYMYVCLAIYLFRLKVFSVKKMLVRENRL